MHSEYTPKRPESLLVEDAEGIVTVTLNRPDIHNAFSSHGKAVPLGRQAT